MPTLRVWLARVGGLFAGRPADRDLSDELNGHLDAHIEDKATFIKNATSDKSKFLSLEYNDPWIRVVGDTAIVRFHWVAESETIPEGK